MLCLAGAVGIEPTQAVLETAVLPLYEAPRKQKNQASQYLHCELDPNAIWFPCEESACGSGGRTS